MFQEMPRMQDFAPFTPELLGALSGPQIPGRKRHLALRGVQSCFATLGYDILNRSMIHINLIDLLSIIHHFLISYTGTQYNIMWWSLSVTCDRAMVFSVYPGFLHQWNWPPRFNWNVDESGVKHHNPYTLFSCNMRLSQLWPKN